MGVPFYDHAKIYKRRKAEIDAAIFKVLDSGRLDWGDEVPSFEGEFAAFVGASHCVTVNSGTAAIKVALLALGIGPGDEVITVPNTDIGTISAIHHVGATCVWVDVDPATLCMDATAARAAVTAKTRAILAVDLYGHPAPLLELRALAQEKRIALVEDACLALGATVGGRKIGSIADITCFSFAPTKHLGSLGSGGACTTADVRLADLMRKISAYGQDRSRHRSIGSVGQPLFHETEGLNERLDEIQAAVLRVKLADVPASLEVRRAQAFRYADGLKGAAKVPSVAPNCTHAFRNYVIHVDKRDKVREHMTAAAIGTALSYSPPMHLQPVYADRGFGPGSFPVTERSAKRLIGLPIGPHLDDAQVDEVIAGVRAAVASVR